MNLTFKEGLSIVIPIYQEKDNIKLLFKKIIKFKKTAHFPFEFILVEGCSDDGTLESIVECINFNNLSNKVKVFSMPSKHGYGHDIMYGLKNAHYNFLAWTHADLQTDLNDILIGYNLIKHSSPNTIVKGRRVGRNFIDKFLTFAMQMYTMIKIGKNIEDINAQPKIFSRDFYKKLLSQNPPNDFSLDLFTLINAKQENFNIETFDVKFKKRLYGQAKGGGGSFINRIKLIKRTITYINNLKKDLN